MAREVFQFELLPKTPQRMEKLHGYVAGCYDPRIRRLKDKYPAVAMDSQRNTAAGAYRQMRFPTIKSKPDLLKVYIGSKSNHSDANVLCFL